jgi:ribosomal protein S18 acetylase RimI-like enzyme
MTNYEFLEKWFQLMNGGSFDGVEDLGSAKASFSKASHIFWNNALIDTLISDDQLQQIEDFYTSKQRTPALYFENTSEHQKLATFLESKGYEKKFEDNWLFYEKTEVSEKRFDTITQVKTDAEFELYMQAFVGSYQEDDPLNPYGAVPEDEIPKSWEEWRKLGPSGRIEKYVALKDGKPVAASGLHSFAGIGYIAPVGSLVSVRGEGFGKAITIYAVKRSIERGNQITCLSTEEGTYPHEFYQRIGFTKKFTALLYGKKS